MSVEDDVWQGFVSSLLSDGHNKGEQVISPEDAATVDDQNKGGQVISPEDAAWVDSCFVKDAELSDSGWDALKDALIDIISSGDSSNDSTSLTENDGFTRQSDDEVVPMNEEAGPQTPGGAYSNLALSSEQAETSFSGGTDDNMTLITEKAEAENFRDYMRNKLSNSNHQMKEEDTSAISEPGLPNETELFPDNIFKVWDLESPEVEEDELEQQLKKALAETPVDKASPPSANNFIIGPGMESLDDLISGLADLSLHQLSDT